MIGSSLQFSLDVLQTFRGIVTEELMEEERIGRAGRDLLVLLIEREGEAEDIEN